jgi:hypothetical protein
MTYDVAEAEKNNQNNGAIHTIGATQTTNNHTLERSDTLRKKWPTDKAYYISKEILMTERTYRRDLDVINLVSHYRFLLHTLAKFVCDAPFKSLNHVFFTLIFLCHFL